MRRLAPGLLLLACACGEREAPGRVWWGRFTEAVAAADADRVAALLVPDLADEARALVAERPAEFAALAADIRACRYVREREAEVAVVESRFLGRFRVPEHARPAEAVPLRRERAVLCTVLTGDGADLELVLARDGAALRLDPRSLLALRKVSYEAPTRIAVAETPDRLPGDGLDGTYKHRGGFWLAKLSKDAAAGGPCVVALATVCTNLGGTPNWLEDEGVIQCPVCGSRYGRDGRRLAGPAPHSLARYAIARDEKTGGFVVDTAQAFREADGGWRDVRSYVPLPQRD